MIRKSWLMLFALLAIPCALYAQSSPNLTYGQIPTAGQWNSYFAAKQDVLGYTPLNQAGGTMLGPLKTTASTTSAAGFNVLTGVAPNVPNNGDIWITSSGLYYRAGNITFGPVGDGTITGPATTVVGHVAKWGDTAGQTLTDGGALGTAAIQNTGTSGANVPLLNAANTWSATQSFSGLSSSTPIPASSGGTGLTSVGTAISANTGTSGHVLPFLDGANTWSAAQNLGTPSAITLTNGTGLPIGGVSGLGTGVATFLGTPTSANLATALTDETGSGAAVFANGPNLTAPNIGAATATSINKVAVTAPATNATLTIANGTALTTTSSTSVGQGQYLGTATNDNATAGNVGEYIQSELPFGSATSMTTGTAKTITSITLTAGDWNVWGLIVLNPAASTVITSFSAAANTTTNTMPIPPNGGSYISQVITLPAGNAQAYPIGMQRYSVSTSTTVYLVSSVNFNTSTLTAYGGIYARRVR